MNSVKLVARRRWISAIHRLFWRVFRFVASIRGNRHLIGAAEWRRHTGHREITNYRIADDLLVAFPRVCGLLTPICRSLSLGSTKRSDGNVSRIHATTRTSSGEHHTAFSSILCGRLIAPACATMFPVRIFRGSRFRSTIPCRRSSRTSRELTVTNNAWSARMADQSALPNSQGASLHSLAL